MHESLLSIVCVFLCALIYAVDFVRKQIARRRRVAKQCQDSWDAAHEKLLEARDSIVMYGPV